MKRPTRARCRRKSRAERQARSDRKRLAFVHRWINETAVEEQERAEELNRQDLLWLLGVALTVILIWRIF